MPHASYVLAKSQKVRETVATFCQVPRFSGQVERTKGLGLTEGGMDEVKDEIEDGENVKERRES